MANKELKRGPGARHIQMIALGGTIGVGLFMGSASTISWTGPSVLLAYAICGIFIFLLCVRWVKCCMSSRAQVLLRHSAINIFIRWQVI